MIDVVYPLGTGSIYKDFELRMSLRSVEKHLSGIHNVYIVGEKPAWLTGIIHIEAYDQSQVTDLNIMRKVAIACNAPEVSDDFLFMNDDHYILQDVEAAKFPYLWSKTMEEYIAYRAGDTYRQRVRNSYNHLKRLGLPTKFFDTHYPIVYDKVSFLHNVVDRLDWKNGHTSNGFVLKSVYANSLRIEGRQEPDHKGSIEPPSGAIAFSTTPHIKSHVQRFLIEHFPIKSKYEGDEPGY